MAVVKIIELLGSSSESFDAAVKAALAEAGKTIRGISGVDVINLKAAVKDNQIVDYKALVKIAFKVE